MRKYMPVILAFTVIIVVAFIVGTMTAKHAQMEQEVIALRDHNERLIKALDYSGDKHQEILALAYNGEADQEQLVKAMDQASEWLWMAETALEELDRVVRQQDSEADIPVIIRDIQEVITRANCALGQATAKDERENG